MIVLSVKAGARYWNVEVQFEDRRTYNVPSERVYVES